MDASSEPPPRPDARRRHGTPDAKPAVHRVDGDPAYNLAVAVDDAAQRPGKVVRGSDPLDRTAHRPHRPSALPSEPSVLPA
jgi:hypothetical protein